MTEGEDSGQARLDSAKRARMTEGKLLNTHKDPTLFLRKRKGFLDSHSTSLRAGLLREVARNDNI